MDRVHVRYSGSGRLHHLHARQQGQVPRRHAVYRRSGGRGHQLVRRTGEIGHDCFHKIFQAGAPGGFRSVHLFCACVSLRGFPEGSDKVGIASRFFSRVLGIAGAGRTPYFCLQIRFLAISLKSVRPARGRPFVYFDGMLSLQKTTYAMQRTGKYTKDDPMSDFRSATTYRILLLMSRFGISLGLGEFHR